MSDKEEDKSKLEPNKSPVSARRAKKLLYLSEYLSKQESRINCKKVSRILKKSAHEHTEDEKATLAKHQDIVKRISKNKEKRKLNQQRVLETEDSEEDLQSKCEKLAKIIQQSKKTVIYTGAGISTAASIPDYRGPQGVWTLLQKGEQLAPQDLSDAEPTLTHMCITQLHKLGHVKHVVSQNCDGLHLRSGLPRHVLSEVHGNMFIEICHNCRPHREYVRLFDVTENTGVRRHFTGRHCQKCGGNLKDTIVHFGEKGGMKSPYRWKEAVKAANRCDLILCLGSSLKILKKYACLWCMDRVKHKRPRLVIVNLQWTPKDESATLKINGRCDDVMERVMQTLQYSIPHYSRDEDPIFSLSTPLTEKEENSTTKKVLQMPKIVPRLRSQGISRTPTPSDSSDSQSSLSSSDSCDTQSDVTHLNSSKLMSVVNLNVFHAESKSDSGSKVSSSTVNSEEMFLSKSERICNEAKLAMQERLVNAKINEMYGQCSYMQDEVSGSTGGVLNGFVFSEQTQLETSVEQKRKIQYDPLRGGPFDPGPSTHEDKLKYLQMLKSQLEELKIKQKLLKEQEQQNLKQQRQQTMKQVRQNELKKKESKVQVQLKQEQRQTDSLKPESDCKVHLKQEIKHENTVIVKQEKCAQSSGHCPMQNIKVYKEKEEKPQICKKLPNSQIINISPNSVAKKTGFIDSGIDNVITDNSRLAEMEQKLKKNELEQKQLKATLSTMLTNQQKLEEQIKVQHRNEHLRLHQHYLIQEQLRQQTKGGKAKKEEILKLFVFQQQSLLAQQNTVLQCLRQNYLLEVQKVQTALQDMQQSHAATKKIFESLKVSSRNKELKPVTKSPMASNMCTDTSVEKACPVQVVIKTVENPSLSNELKSPKKDHSIAAILQGGSPSNSNTLTSTNVKSSASDRTKLCESCQFLNGYGMQKKWCTKCEELKSNNGVVKQNLAKSKSRVDTTFLEHANVPKEQNTQDKIFETGKCSNDQNETVYNYVLDLEIPNAKELKSYETLVSPRKQLDLDNHNYLLITENSVKNNSELKTVVSSPEKVESETVLSISPLTEPTFSIALSTSLSTCTMSKSSNECKTSILPSLNKVNANYKVNEKSGIDIFERNESDLISKPSERVTFTLNDDVGEKSKIDEWESLEKDGKQSDLKKACGERACGEKACGEKPLRSHSQSEIYDQKQGEIAKEPPGLRHIRCHSHSDVETAVIDNDADSEDTADSVPSIGAEDKEVSDPAVKTGRKRKLGRCLSVPGWFGKGLNIKKRRRY